MFSLVQFDDEFYYICKKKTSKEKEVKQLYATKEVDLRLSASLKTIHMIVSREEKPLEEIEVELCPKPAKGLGICITGFTCSSGAYISELIPGGSAAENGKLVRGDRIIAISGEDAQALSVEDVALLIKASNPVNLKVTRLKSTRT